MTSPCFSPSERKPAARRSARACRSPYETGCGPAIANAVSRPGRPTRSRSVSFSGMARRLRAREPAVQVEHPLAPGGKRVIGFEQRESAHDAPPLEQAEQDVVRIGRLRAGDEWLRAQARARRIEQTAKTDHVLVAVGGELLERLAERLLHHAAQVTPVGIVDDVLNVARDQR